MAAELEQDHEERDKELETHIEVISELYNSRKLKVHEFTDTLWAFGHIFVFAIPSVILFIYFDLSIETSLIAPAIGCLIYGIVVVILNTVLERREFERILNIAFPDPDADKLFFAWEIFAIMLPRRIRNDVWQYVHWEMKEQLIIALSNHPSAFRQRLIWAAFAIRSTVVWLQCWWGYFPKQITIGVRLILGAAILHWLASAVGLL